MAMDPGAVLVDDVWESYRIYSDNPAGLKDRLVGRRTRVANEFWALQGVSAELAPGDTLALVGANGSGKSTLLKCLAGILVPTKGRVEHGGRLAAMLEVGAGFHPDLTGRENVFLNASILGFSKRKVAEVFDEIVEFAELEDFINAPVRTYSTGMYLRLGFAVSIHLDPDVLLIDEVLAVGDARFVARCFDRIHQMKRRGVTIIVVTHDLDTAASLCDNAIYLEKGVVKHVGPARETVDHYRGDVAAAGGGALSRWEGGPVYGTGEVEIQAIHLEPDEPTVRTGERFAVCFEALGKQDVEDPVYGMILRSSDGTYLYDTNTSWRAERTGPLATGERHLVRFELTANLLPGNYLVTVGVSRSDGRTQYDWHTDALTVAVTGSSAAHGVVELDGRVEVGRASDAAVRALGS
ncbi:MAG: lipopolysaccharide transport system ATP-binding protein [Acidimicrobiaceae bacterium]|jgi:ABC-type polysaccharide/polyol phosphate transport system ATPase subunit